MVNRTTTRYWKAPSTRTLLSWALVALSVGVAAAQKEQVIYSFMGTPDGANPYGSLIVDSLGNLFGATSGGGSTVSAPGYGCGTVFELKPVQSGYVESVIWTFQSVSTTDGCSPSASLILDSSGNLYGTTPVGGAYKKGTIFELSPDGSGGWTEEILWNFGGTLQDGYGPYSSLARDAAGKLYGTTYWGGQVDGETGAGTVFELSPSLNGGWSETILHTFAQFGGDGQVPMTGVTLDTVGNIYGTTVSGGNMSCPYTGCGTIYKLEMATGAYSQLYLFTGGLDGSNPSGGLIFDSAGHLYGTATTGGGGNGGVVFELGNIKGQWMEKVLYALGTNTSDGTSPAYVTLLENSRGRLFGTTQLGPGACGCGAVFEIDDTTTGWTETVLHAFGTAGDGLQPFSGVVSYDGTLYGMTYSGGTAAKGAVFAVTR
jgi:uncharacterized repeat protein (TIGR03803 family)